MYCPCTLGHVAYRRTGVVGGLADLRSVRGMLLDLGASISVLDIKRAERMARDGAANVVRYGHAEVAPARVAGGGYISIADIAAVEFCVRDSVSGEWQPFKERFHLGEGSTTCILASAVAASDPLVFTEEAAW